MNVINSRHAAGQKMTNRPKIGISACLLGSAVRFDGGHRRDPFLTNVLGPFVEWFPICPEVEVGMTIPRESVRLIDGAGIHMVAERSGKDWTDQMNGFAHARASALAPVGLAGYIFKKNSPSCGLERVRIYNSKGMPSRQGRGLFAAVLLDRFPQMPAEEEGRLQDPTLRENFIERIFAYHRWQTFRKSTSARALIEFHTQHKFLLLAHSDRHYRRLGRIVAATADRSVGESVEAYGAEFMDALAVHATAKKHSNVLQHMLGYFSKELSTDERKEVSDLIEDFRRQLVPLIAPITLMRHYVKKYDVSYLQDQIYLEPSPKELMLRNHV
jgi:uncharacterized protein YbgA (DUF1722 family)/uncharacterized protein YbbK (DUF523 family)